MKQGWTCADHHMLRAHRSAAMQSNCMTVMDMSDGHFLSCIAALMHRHPYTLIQSSALLLGGH